jgi:hypothetical protein
MMLRQYIFINSNSVVCPSIEGLQAILLPI